MTPPQISKRKSDDTRCAGCHASIRWYPNVNTGKRAPVNVTPDANGNVVLEDGNYRVLRKHEIGNQPLFDAPTRYTLHFATCPTPEKFRRRDVVKHRAKETTT